MRPLSPPMSSPKLASQGHVRFKDLHATKEKCENEDKSQSDGGVKAPNYRHGQDKQHNVRDDIGETAPDKQGFGIDAMGRLLLRRTPMRREGRTAKQVGETSAHGCAD